jgi:glucosyl-3-phosphoglycerate synthase
VGGRGLAAPEPLLAYHHTDFPPARVAAQRETSISVCLPARNEIATIGAIVEALLPLVDVGAIDQLAVVDDSDDGTGELARRLGAEVYDQSTLCPGLGPLRGKGDAMWRALSVLTGDVVCYLDADSGLFGAHYATGLAGAVALPGGVSFAKAFYRRPFFAGTTLHADGGGRVTELTARPLLHAFFPELAAVAQPLAGEIALRRRLAEALRFPLGYGVDVALLIDAWHLVGPDGLAQVDLDTRQNRHAPCTSSPRWPPRSATPSCSAPESMDA